MTESEWMTSNDPAAMLRSLVSRFSAMKRRGETPDLERLRFFACVCCRRIWDLFDEDHRKSIEMIEAYCSAPTPNGLRAARRIRWAAGNRASNEVDRVSRAVPCDRAECLAAWARNAASSAVWQAADKNPAKAANCHREVAEAVHSMKLANGATSDGPDPGFIGYKLPSGGELIAQALLLREIIGNPFRGALLVGGTGRRRTYEGLDRAGTEEERVPGREILQGDRGDWPENPATI